MAAALLKTLSVLLLLSLAGLQARGLEARPEVRIIALGDSHLASSGACQTLGLRLQELLPSVQVRYVPLGVNGGTFEQLKASLEGEGPFPVGPMARYQPTLVLLAFGTNEAMRPVDRHEFFEALGSVIFRIRQRCPKARLVMLTPPDGACPWLEEVLFLERVAARTARIDLIDRQALMGGPGGSVRWGTAREPLMARDRIHLTAAGYARLNRLVAGQLAPMVEAELQRRRP